MVESVDPDGVFRTAVCHAAYTAITGRLAPAISYRDFKSPVVRAGVERAGYPVRGCVETRMRFVLPRARGGPEWAPTEGGRDVEKLVRNVHDALMDVGVLVDDAQVTTLGRISKRFVDEDSFESPGAYVMVLPDLEESALPLDAMDFEAESDV
jgi:hypothetical protein